MSPLARLLAAGVVFAAAACAQPRGGVFPKAKGRQARPMRQVEKFSRLTPEERKRVIEGLPPDRQKEVERNLEHYQKLTPEEKSRLNGQLESFRSLPPEKQQRARRLFREVNQLPEERRLAIRREMAHLWRLSPEERGGRLEHEEFRSRFSEDERKVIRELTTLMPEHGAPEE